ncbi:MAG: YifB family Mg chelatase-like AAA ATPase [Phycisphaerales bacterium]
MLVRIPSFALQGIEAVRCDVEVSVQTRGLPRISLVGLADLAVRESIERVRSALEASGFEPPRHRVTINLAPADLRKQGPAFDLPIAVALLLALPEESPPARRRALPSPQRWMLAGELGLDGSLRPVRGVVSMAMLARERGLEGIVIPAANAGEAAVVEGVQARTADSLPEVVAFFRAGAALPPVRALDVRAAVASARAPVDFAEVRGQGAAKRALVIAAAGGHNALLIGPAGCGKTMMARAMPGILPALEPEEALDVTRIWSAAGAMGPGRSLVTERPFRAPHHSASTVALVGGGTLGLPRPGEVTLAHRGVLFLDELPEFGRSALEALREPLEDGFITIARAHGSARFPAQSILVAAMNPTARGNRRAGDRGAREAQAYLERVSGPIVDRIDLHVEVQPVPVRRLAGGVSGAPAGEASEAMRARVAAARAAQRARQGPVLNAHLRGPALDAAAALDTPARTLLADAIERLGLSARAYDKVRRVARTIADLESSARVDAAHVAEAVQYRILDRHAG